MFEFRDYFQIRSAQTEGETQLKDSVTKGEKKGIRVTMEATHSGTFNLNKRFYLPTRMSEGVQTFKTEGKKTKVLKHHDPGSDPVGVVHSVRYVPTVPDNLKDNEDVKVLVDESANVKDQLKAARNLIKSGAPFQDDWKGLGYIEIVADITDKDTVEQVLDGRFDAVSTSFISPGQVFCSTCGDNMAKDMFHKHIPGMAYPEVGEDGEEIEGSQKAPCAIIPGIHDYKEVSFVVFDGDPLTQVVVNDETGEVQDELCVALDTGILLDESSAAFSDMVETPVVKEEKQEEEVQAGTEEDSKQEEEENSDEITYSDFEKELDELELSDAKLSPEQREKLPESSFCGPDRSFPVPNKAHVTAARRLIGRYKGPGDKEKIHACIERKAKALGMDKEDKKDVAPQEVQDFDMPSYEQMDKLEDKDVKNLFAISESELIKRQLKVDRECSKCTDYLQRAEKAENSDKEKDSEIAELKDTLEVLRDEVKRIYADYTHLADEVVDLRENAKEEKAKRLSVLSVLNGDCETLEESSAKFSDMDENEMKPFEAKLDEFKLEDFISEKNHNSGMANEPKGTVEDPTVNIDKDVGLPDLLKSHGITSPLAVDKYWQIRDLYKEGTDFSIGQARSIFDKMKHRFHVYGDLTFDEIVSDLKNQPNFSSRTRIKPPGG